MLRPCCVRDTWPDDSRDISTPWLAPCASLAEPTLAYEYECVSDEPVSVEDVSDDDEELISELLSNVHFFQTMLAFNGRNVATGN